MTQTEIDVSVYVPARNRSPLVRRLEVIVVNDASTNDTSTVIQEMSGEDESIGVIHQPEARRAPVACDVAIEIARGCIITDPDDVDAFKEKRIAGFAEAWCKLQDRGIPSSGRYCQPRMPPKGQASVSQRPKSMGSSGLLVQNDIGNQLFASKAHCEASGFLVSDTRTWRNLDLFIRMVSTSGRGQFVDGTTDLYDNDDRADHIPENGHTLRQAVRGITEKHSGWYPNLGPVSCKCSTVITA